MILTPTGLASVRMPSEKSLNVKDMVTRARTRLSQKLAVPLPGTIDASNVQIHVARLRVQCNRTLKDRVITVNIKHIVMSKGAVGQYVSRVVEPHIDIRC